MRTYTADEVDAMIGRALARERERVAQQQEPKLPEFYARFEDGLVSVYQRREDATPLLLLRENLPDKQPAQQEPVAWMYVNKSTHETKFQKHMRDFIDHSLWSEVPLYGEPLANHELQCICGAIWLGDEMVHLPDKRLPPQRTWVGLTDEDWKQIFLTTNETTLPRAIEAKLKEKNT